MKKLLFLIACGLLVLPAVAQRVTECALTPLQNLIVNARGAEEVQALISRGVVFDEQVRCGGSLMQLAVRRGNPDVLEAIVRQDPNRVNTQAVLDAFPIAGAPKQIPLILFAAYYAPNKQIMDLLVAAGANIAATDDYGRNILWYLNKNPVLRNTALQDELNNKLLYGMVAAQAQDQAGVQNRLPQAQPVAQAQPVPQQAQPAVAKPAEPVPADNLVAE
ncbi:MAG: hypothetical protein II938_04645 [Alphaproteobacteria bacterium]|nr:hypothetical protein [Alphaproteobacteria bacterium]